LYEANNAVKSSTHVMTRSIFEMLNFYAINLEVIKLTGLEVGGRYVGAGVEDGRVVGGKYVGGGV
jgi:hypothetical protein